MALNPLDPLTAALQRKSQATAKLEGVNEDYSRATALRDQDLMGAYNPKLGNYGTGDLGTVLRGVESIMAGNKAKELKPQRMAARQEVANTENALPLWNAERMLEKEATEKSRYDARTTAEAAKEAKSDARYIAEQKVKKNSRKSEDLIGLDGVVQRYDVGPDGKVYDNGVEVGDRSDYPKAPTKTQEVSNAGGYGGKGDDKESRAYRNTIRNIDYVYSLMADVKPEQEKMLNSTGYRAKMALLETMTPQAFDALVKERFAGYDDATRKMMISLHSMSSRERNRLFGSALTKPEIKSSQDFLANTIGRGLPFVRDALNDTKTENIDMLLGVDAQYGNSKYKNMLVSEGVIPKDYTRTTFELGVEPEMGSDVGGSTPTFSDPEKEARFLEYEANNPES